MKKNLAKKITMSILAGAMLMSSSVVWAGTKGDFIEASGKGAIAIGGWGSIKPTASGESSVAIGNKANATGNRAVAIGQEAVATKDQAVAIGYKAEANYANSVAIGLYAEANGDSSVAIGDGAIAGADYVVSVGNGGANDDSPHYRKIVNVKDGNIGEDSHDAVTGGQLFTELDKKADKATTLAGYGIGDAYTKSEVDAKFANAATGGTVDLSAYAKQTDLTNLNDEVVKTNEELQKTNSNVSKINEELVKTNDHFNKELRNTNTQVVANAENIANIQNATIDLNQRLDKTNAKINKVGAGAAALAALHPLEYDPDDKLTFSAGMGNYAGENAAALGAFYRPNEKFMVSLGGTMGNGENMVNLGLSIGLDKPNGYAKLSKRELIQKVNAMEAKYEAVEAENEAMKDQLANADERIAKLEALVAQLVKK